MMMMIKESHDVAITCRDCGEYQYCSAVNVGEDDENKYQFHKHFMMMMIVRFRLPSKVNNLLIFQ
jgi:hypothetical protein